MNAEDVQRIMNKALRKRDKAIAAVFAGLMYCIAIL